MPRACRRGPLESEPLLHLAGHRNNSDASLRHPGDQRPPGDPVRRLPVLWMLWGKWGRLNPGGEQLWLHGMEDRLNGLPSSSSVPTCFLPAKLREGRAVPSSFQQLSPTSNFMLFSNKKVWPLKKLDWQIFQISFLWELKSRFKASFPQFFLEVWKMYSHASCYPASVYIEMFISLGTLHNSKRDSTLKMRS